MPSPTRGSQPAHVYRRRRLVVITVAVLLVFGIGRVLSSSSDGSGGGDQAVQSAADTTPSGDPSEAKTKKNKGKGKKDKNKTPKPTPTPTPTPLAEPSGTCPDSDVTVTPSIPEPVGGRDVTVLLNLQTGATEACTWHLSAETVTLSIIDGPDEIWSSDECAQVIPSTDVVVRRAQATVVPVVWNAKRSDEYCTIRTAWVLPGLYTVRASVLGGEPTVVDFELTTPVAEVVTQTAEPTEKPDKGKGKGKNKPD